MNWNFFYHIGIISFSLLLAALLRSRIRFFQRFPNPGSHHLRNLVIGLLQLRGTGLGAQE